MVEAGDAGERGVAGADAGKVDVTGDVFSRPGGVEADEEDVDGFGGHDVKYGCGVEICGTVCIVEILICTVLWLCCGMSFPMIMHVSLYIQPVALLRCSCQ